jgi:ubiquinone/menaquinone biosynthesis C-methylase UbiE
LALNDRVRAFWEQGPVGTSKAVTGELPPLTHDWFEQVEENRYRREPMIHGVAQFTRHRGKSLLEVGVGAGTDHLQWARAGALCHGVDLTNAAIETTRARLQHYGFTSDLQRVDAEKLPFADESFDLVYSWGVIHHAESPESIVAEIRRTLKPGGQFIGMMYNRHSASVYKEWVKHALLRGKPLRSLGDVMWNHFESIGTKSYTVAELESMFAAFSEVEVWPIITEYDRQHLPRFVGSRLSDHWGVFLAIRAVK